MYVRIGSDCIQLRNNQLIGLDQDQLVVDLGWIGSIKLIHFTL